MQPAVSISSCSGPEFATRTRSARGDRSCIRPGMRAVLRCDTPCAARGMVPSSCSSQHIVEAQLKVAYHDYLEVGYAGHVSSPAKFE